LIQQQIAGLSAIDYEYDNRGLLNTIIEATD